MLTPRPAPQPRAGRVNLLIFFAFALAALVLLTHTLVDVYQARAAVAGAVRPATGGIEADTALLPALARTNLLTGRLAHVSQGVNDSLTQVAGSMRNIDATIVAVRSDAVSIARSVRSIAGSAAFTEHGLVALDSDITSIRDGAGRTSTAFAAADRAVATLPTELARAAASLRTLARLIPAITQQAASIRTTLVAVDGHLVNVNDSVAIRLSNLLQLSNLLGAGG